METKPMNQTNETKTTIHTYEQGNPCYPFSILEITETNNETGDTKQTFEPILGNIRICEIPFKEKEMTEEYIKSKPYDLILALIIHTMDMKERYIKEQQELLKNKENESK